MKTNDIKKGMKFQLRNGWHATMQDNVKGNARLALVEGDYTEMGSVYAHDIIAVFVNGQMIKVEHTPAQMKHMQMLSAMGW
jgi:hypothetical protein